MRTIAFILLAISGASNLRSQVPSEPADLRIMSVVRPWIADAVGLSEEQRERATACVAKFQSEMRIARHGRNETFKNPEKFLTEQEQVSSTLKTRSEVPTLRDEAIRTLREFLNEQQVRQVLELELKDRPVSQSVFVEVDSSSLLQILNALSIEKLKLTKEQDAEIRAMLLKAEADLKKEERDEDKRLSEIRQQLNNTLREMLSQNSQNPSLFSKLEPAKGKLQIFQNVYNRFSDPGTFSKYRRRPVSKLGSMSNGIEPKRADVAEFLIWHPEDEVIDCVSYSPNGQWIVSVGITYPGIKQWTEIRLWDTKTGELVDSVKLGANTRFTRVRVEDSAFDIPFTASISFTSSEHVTINMTGYSERKLIAP